MATIRGHLADSLLALRGAFRNPAVRRVELAYAGSAIGLYANAIAVAVYAFHHGGATAVGVFMFVRLGVSALAAPFTASLADRHPQARVMLAADLSRVATVSATAAAAAAGLPIAVYGLATLTTAISTAFRPAEASLLPAIAASPEELTAANVSTSTFDSVGSFAGPAIAAGLLALGGPTLAFGVVAVTYLWSASFVARIHPPALPAAKGSEISEHGEGLAAGLRAVRHEPRLRLLIGLYGMQALIGGAYTVFVVVIALQLLGLGNAGVGLLEAATGVGALIGAAVTFALVARRRTASDLALGLMLFGLPLVAVAALPHTWAVVIALGVLGIGNSLVDVSAVTLLQRTTPSAVAARVFGLLEATLIGALALGSLLVPLLVHLLGLRTALVVAGAVLPVLALLSRRPLVRIDTGAAVPEEQLAAIASAPFLAALPLTRQEALAAALERVPLRAGAVLFSRGDHGDRFYVLAAGALEIDLPDGVKREDAPAFVGEIALLRDVPRTATVRAATDATLWALDRDRFLDAVSGHARSHSAAESVVASRGALSTV